MKKLSFMFFYLLSSYTSLTANYNLEYFATAQKDKQADRQQHLNLIHSTPNLSNKGKVCVPQQNQIKVLSEVVSVCSGKDILTWQKASKQIVKNISAKHYKVIVPDNAVNSFKLISDKRFEVIPESKYLPEAKNLLRKYIPADKSWRLGWYLQQLLKIAALKSGKDGEIILIWDADTIPLKPLHFIDSNGKLIYYKGIEYHKPYFECIRRLLGLEKTVDFSFIAQCFVSNASWVKEFCKNLEEKFKMPWDEAILNHVNFNEISGFSEYETLGTFYTAKYLDHITFCDNPWERLGKSLLGSIAELTEEKIFCLSDHYDFIAFEGWDPGDNPSSQTQHDSAQFEAFIKAIPRNMKSDNHSHCYVPR